MKVSNNKIVFIQEYIHDVLIFLMTSWCEDFLIDITKESRTETINVLAKIEKNIAEVFKNEKI